MSPTARIMLRWRTPDPSAATRRLATLGFDIDRLAFEGGSIVVEAAPGERGDRLALDSIASVSIASVPAGEGAPAHPNGLSRLVAVGWATVDLERAADAFGLPFLDMAPDRLLGARAARLSEGPIVLLEPNTEARLAATLARWGEGPVALYLAAVDGRLPDGAWPVTVGPFGRSALLDPGAVHGPHLIACDGLRRR